MKKDGMGQEAGKREMAPSVLGSLFSFPKDGISDRYGIPGDSHFPTWAMSIIKDSFSMKSGPFKFR